MVPHWALAIGGIHIAVPTSQVSDARELLLSFESTSQDRSTCVSQILNGAGWLAFGVSSPWPDLIIRD